MKRVTIAMNDDLYRTLLEYAADQSKLNVRRLSIGEAVRTLITAQLQNVGYRETKRAAPVAPVPPIGETLYLRRSHS